MIKKWWWKILGIAIMLYVLIKGLTTEVPKVDIIEQSIRNLFFHVPMWMVMMVFLLISASFGVAYLRNQNLNHDRWSLAFVEISLLMGIAGCITGAFWAKATWGAFWPDDPKLKGVALGMLIYAAMLILRAAIPEVRSRAKISAIYGIFVYPIFIAFIYVLPKMNPGLHPGSGDTVKFVDYNVISKDLRLVFYPAILGWALIFGWIVQLRYRFLTLIHKSLLK